MRLLAVSFMLPPMLYPQAVQIGRLLAGCRFDLVTVCGQFADGKQKKLQSLDFNSGHISVHRFEFPHRTMLNGLMHRLAMRLVPFYGRTPDEFRKWSKMAAAQVTDWLASPSNTVDVMVTFGEPMSDHLVGLAVKRRFGTPWLVHFSDPWADNPFRSFQPLANWRNRQLEAEVIKNADSVAFTSEETRNLVMKKYPSKWIKKTFVLPHSFDPVDFKSIPVSKKSDERLNIRYLGNFYGHRTPFPLISALAQMVQKTPDILKDVRFQIVGSLPVWMRMHPALRRLPEGLLEFCPSVKYSDSLELMASSDLLMVIDAPAKESVFLPSKLVDYIGSGRPIFGIVPPGASKKLIERLGGLTADPNNLNELVSNLVEAITQARSLRGMSGGWGVEEVRQEFVIDKIAGKFSEIVAWTKTNSIE